MNSTPFESTHGERTISEIASELQGLLRRNDTVAYVVGVKQARTVKNWIEGQTSPADPLMRRRLEVAEKLALTVQDPTLPHLSGAWLIAINPRLEEESPAELIQSLQGTEGDAAIIDRLQAAADLFLVNAL
jgi:hypothetical protein